MKWLTLNSSAILCRGESLSDTCGVRMDGRIFGSDIDVHGVMLPSLSLHWREMELMSDVLDASAAVHMSYAWLAWMLNYMNHSICKDLQRLVQ